METKDIGLYHRIDDKAYRYYQDEIRRVNLKNLRAGSFIGMVLGLILLLISILPLGILHMVYAYFMIALIFGGYYALCKSFLNDKRGWVLPFYYSFIVLILLVAILMGSVWGRTTNATTFLMFLMVFSLCIIDRPRNIRIVMGCMCVIFCIAVYLTKGHTLHNMDITNCAVFYIVSCFVSQQMIQTKMTDIIVKNQLKQQRDIDMLTELHNRGSLERTVQQYIHESNKNAVLIIMDLDNFKKVNDTLGHGAGDQLLREVSDLLKAAFRPSDIVSRLGGDEFVVFLPAIDSLEVVKKRLDDLLEKINALTFEGDQSIQIGASIGIAQYPFHGCTFEELYARADSALYDVKEHGKNRYLFYDLQEKTKILVVDDIEVGRAILRNTLEGRFEILEASDGVQAWEILQHRKEIKMVITDVQMPKMDGMELIRRIRSDKTYEKTAIIACTEFGNELQEKELFEIGIDDFIAKPFMPKVIEIRVNNVLKSKLMI